MRVSLRSNSLMFCLILNLTLPSLKAEKIQDKLGSRSNGEAYLETINQVYASPTPDPSENIATLEEETVNIEPRQGDVLIPEYSSKILVEIESLEKKGMLQEAIKIARKAPATDPFYADIYLKLQELSSNAANDARRRAAIIFERGKQMTSPESRRQAMTDALRILESAKRDFAEAEQKAKNKMEEAIQWIENSIQIELNHETKRTTAGESAVVH